MTQYIYPPLDQAPSDLYQQFVNTMQGFIPDWQPQSGNLDDWIAQAFSGIAAQLAEISTDVATSIYRYFGANIAGLPPVSAVQAQGLTNWVATDTAGYTIPAGTHLVFTDASGNTQGFSTVSAATISPGASGVNGVAVIADNAGSAGNNITGTAQLVAPLAWVSSVSLSSPTTGGSDAEDDDAYLNRLKLLYTVLTPKPVIATDFSTLALQQSGVGRAVTVDGFDPASITVTGTVTSGSASATNVSNINAIPVGAGVTGANIPASTFVKTVIPGSNTFIMSANATASATGENITIGGSLLNGGEVSTFVTDSSGNALTSTAMSSVQAALAAQRLANFKINVLAPTYTTINVVATVYAWPGQSTSSIQTAVQSAIQSFLSQATWGLPPQGQSATWFNDPVVRYANLEHAILAVPGVHYVSSLTLNGGTSDIYLSGVVPLPTAGTVTATVNLG